MIDDSAIESIDLDLGEKVRLRVCLKMIENKKYIDVRKWIKYPNLDHHVATKRGIMLSIEDWKKVMPLIQSMIEKYCEEGMAKAA